MNPLTQQYNIQYNHIVTKLRVRLHRFALLRLTAAPALPSCTSWCPLFPTAPRVALHCSSNSLVCPLGSFTVTTPSFRLTILQQTPAPLPIFPPPPGLTSKLNMSSPSGMLPSGYVLPGRGSNFLKSMSPSSVV